MAGLESSYPITNLVVILAAASDLAGIAVVGVDAAEDSTVLCNYVVHDNVACTSVTTAVTTASDDLSVAIHVLAGYITAKGD